MSLNPHQHAKLAVLRSVSSAMDKMMTGKMHKPKELEVDVASGGEVSPSHPEPHSSALDMTGEDMEPKMENSLDPLHTPKPPHEHDLHAKSDPSMSHDHGAPGDEEDLEKLRDLYSKIK